MACYDAPAIPTSNVCTRRPRRSKVNGVAIGRKRKGPGKYSVSAQAHLPAHFSVCKRYWLGCGAPRPVGIPPSRYAGGCGFEFRRSRVRPGHIGETQRIGHIGYTFSFFRGSDAVQGVFGDGRMAAWPSLPDGVEIAHRNRYRLAGIGALGDVDENAVAKLL